MSLLSLSDSELAALGATHSPTHVLVLDADLRVRYVNRFVGGLTRKTTLGAAALDFVPPEHRDRVHGHLVRVLTSGEPSTYETGFEGPDGQRRYHESRVARVEVEGEFGLVISTSDISDRKAALFDLEEFFHRTDNLMAVLDVDGHFLRVNRSFTKAMGFTTEEMAGQHQSGFVHPEDLEALATAMGQDVPQVEVTFRALPADGDPLLLEVTFVRVVDHDHFIAVGRDVTSARSMERQLIRSQKMEAIGRLAGGVAHDFNNLLTSVLVNTQLALDELEKNHPARELLESVVHAGNLSADLTRQLLAMSRRGEIKRSELSLNRLIEKLLTMLKRTIPATVEIDFIPGRRLPKVRADGSQLEQVLLNLCLNARDAMAAGGRLTISTDAVIVNGEYTRAHPWARPGRYVLVQVSDTGVGMPAELQDRIFEPFFTTKAPGHGTGLGMTIAYEVVQRHEGMLHVYSEPGRGTTIKVYLPATVGQASAIPSRPEGGVPQGRERILLSEDEPLVRAVIERVLKRAGYVVTSTTNGAEALAVLDAKTEFDLIMMDVVMPQMGGADVARVLRDRGDTTPIVLASGYSHGALDSPEFREIPLLQKPFDPDTLLRVVRKLLDGDDDG
ncbi:MAG: PAS domain S-box protein [Deltaproteobacteria bacterium]|nr:PAS domain S-box protein [Deltaproteobacteria bacterium]